MPARHLPLIAALCLLAACAVPPRETPVTYADETARALAQQGLHAQAALEYLRIAEQARSPDAEEFRLAAAAAYLDAGELEPARAILSRLDPAGQPVRIGQRHRILGARLALLEDDPEAALETLARLDREGLPPDLARETHAVGAAARERTGDLAGAARERAALDPLLAEAPEIDANRRALWNALTRLGHGELTALVRPPPDTFGGWVELALLRARYLADATGLEAALGGWRARYPGHPAGPAIVPEVLAQSAELSRPPRQIALLLPLSGQYQAPAQAVRDGFLARSFLAAGEPGGASRPAVRIYDSSGADVPALYRRARAEGADFIVGPLRKEAVAALAAVAPDVPTLALNQRETPPGGSAAAGGPGPPPAAFFQFGLPPEQEARQVAERARRDGFTHAIMLRPESAWGDRVAGAFADHWSDLGGSLLEDRRYGGDANALAATVREILGIGASVARQRKLQGVLNVALEHEPRRRRDVDFIFLAAFPAEARQLRPQIDFFHASDVPIYATSHVFTGRPDVRSDRDLDGIVFCDMPWVVAPALPPPDLRARVVAAWPARAERFPRFYAFGADAYALVSRVAGLRSRPGERWPGYSGDLSVDGEGKVQRELVWAAFRDGIPRTLDGTN